MTIPIYASYLNGFRILPVILTIYGLTSEEAIRGAGGGPFYAVDLAAEYILVLGGCGLLLRAADQHGKEKGDGEEEGFHEMKFMRG